MFPRATTRLRVRGHCEWEYGEVSPPPPVEPDTGGPKPAETSEPAFPPSPDAPAATSLPPWHKFPEQKNGAESEAPWEAHAEGERKRRWNRHWRREYDM